MKPPPPNKPFQEITCTCDTSCSSRPGWATEAVHAQLRQLSESLSQKEELNGLGLDLRGSVLLEHLQGPASVPVPGRRKGGRREGGKIKICNLAFTTEEGSVQLK